MACVGGWVAVGGAGQGVSAGHTSTLPAQASPASPSKASNSTSQSTPTTLLPEKDELELAQGVSRGPSFRHLLLLLLLLLVWCGVVWCVCICWGWLRVGLELLRRNDERGSTRASVPQGVQVREGDDVRS